MSVDAALTRLAQLQVHRAQLDATEQLTLAFLVRHGPRELDRDHSGGPQFVTDRDVAVELDKGWIREEIACALRMASAAVASRLAFATTLVEQYPATFALLQTGAITLWHTKALVDRLVGVPVAVAAEVERRVLPRAPEQTAVNFARSVKRALASVDPADAQEKHERCREQRRVVISHRDNGMSDFYAYLPSEDAIALYDHINAKAKTTPDTPPDGLPDTRSADQRRADTLAALAYATTGSGWSRGASIHLTMTLQTALGLDDQPADLAGVGPITAAHARHIAYQTGSTWRRLVTDPLGNLLDLATHAYRPPPRLRRFIELRDQTCRFPHCTRPAGRCELDHIQPWPEGPTNPDNLHPLCSRHHHCKHETAWTITRHEDGTTRWTSPTNRTYDVPPHHHDTAAA